MNAKKIMGAVLVALLAAALFVGAGAAGYTAGETVFVYQTLDPSYKGTWNYVGEGAYSFTIGTSGGVVSDVTLPAGKYEKDSTNFVYLKAPTGTVSAIKMDGGNEVASIIGGTVADNSVVKFNVSVPAAVSGVGLIFIGPNGIATTEFAGKDFATSASQTVTLNDNIDAGEWKVMAYFDASVTGMNALYLPVIGADVFTFTIADSTQSIALNADSVISGNVFTAVITGAVGDKVTLSFDKTVTIIDGQPGVSGNVVTIGKTGSTTVGFVAEEDGDVTVTAKFNSNGEEKEAKIKVLKGAVTVTADAESFFIGNPIKVSGTTTAGKNLYFYIEGTNFPFVQISADKFEKGAEWTAEFDSNKIDSNQKFLIAGTYTLVVSTLNVSDTTDSAVQAALLKAKGDKKDAVMSAIYSTAAITMTQPFLTGIEANGVAIQGVDYEVTGTAYAANFVRIYLFGTNFFGAAVVPVDADDETFEFTLDKDVSTDMAPGTYFYLIQHPMEDKLFNVWNETGLTSKSWYFVDVYGAMYAGNDEPTGKYDDGTTYYNGANFYYAPTGQSVQGSKLGSFIFNVYDRGTNYAAQALLEEISGQKIDDIFVQGTFEVEAQKLTINPIPAEVAKGSKLAVSGTSNSGEGVEVIVNVLAGKFGATVKGDENSATFLTAKAVTQEDGTFEAAIDTSKLELGNYIVTVEIAGTMYDSAAVEIVEAAAPEQPEQPEEPEQPEQPEQPEAPATPGFGALAALAGLGAVAVLLLRRE